MTTTAVLDAFANNTVADEVHRRRIEECYTWLHSQPSLQLEDGDNATQSSPTEPDLLAHFPPSNAAASELLPELPDEQYLNTLLPRQPPPQPRPQLQLHGDDFDLDLGFTQLNGSPPCVEEDVRKTPAPQASNDDLHHNSGDECGQKGAETHEECLGGHPDNVNHDSAMAEKSKKRPRSRDDNVDANDHNEEDKKRLCSDDDDDVGNVNNDSSPCKPKKRRRLD